MMVLNKFEIYLKYLPHRSRLTRYYLHILLTTDCCCNKSQQKNVTQIKTNNIICVYENFILIVATNIHSLTHLLLQKGASQSRQDNGVSLNKRVYEESMTHMSRHDFYNFIYVMYLALMLSFSFLRARFMSTNTHTL